VVERPKNDTGDVLVQIYGITTLADARLVADMKPDHVGVVVDEGIETWDSVDEATAAAIVAALDGVRVVALSLSADPDRMLRTVELLRPEVLHLARVAERLTPAEVGAVRRLIAPVELMVTIPVRGAESVAVAQAFAPSADYLLVDTADPASGVVGATGLAHDWSVSAGIVAEVDVPVVLAGGLGPDNVTEAIERVRPAGVDSETRTSHDHDRRRKDPEKVRRFIALARASAAPGRVEHQRET
jgi:phosphoribosylanthranilate isomerase